VKGLRKFAKAMKWPNLAVVKEVLQETDPNAKALEDRSSDTMSYFTGMILPGPTLPWLIMNSLIDCDSDATALAALTHMHPHSGFQYKSTTYWSATSIVGKVLSPTCRDIAGCKRDFLEAEPPPRLKFFYKEYSSQFRADTGLLHVS